MIFITIGSKMSSPGADGESDYHGIMRTRESPGSLL